MKRFLAAFPFAIFALAAAAQVAPGTVDDKQFSLKKGSVLEVSTPMPFEYEDGAKTTRPLAGSGMPVMISHTVDDDLPITAEKNGCIRCHSTTGQKKRGAPPLLPDHLSASGPQSVDGKRWNCMLCHAPQADVKPLVANSSQ